MFARMKTGTKILAAFAVAIVVATFVGAVAYVSATRIGDKLIDVTTRKIPSYDALWVMDEAQTAIARGVNASLSRFSDAQVRHANFEYVDAKLASMAEARKAYEAISHSEAATAEWRRMQVPWEAWERAIKDTIVLARQRHELQVAGKSVDSTEMLSNEERLRASYLEARRLYAPAEAAVGAVKAVVAKDIEEAKKGGEAAISSGVLMIVVAILLGSTGVLLLGFFLSRSIGDVLKALVAEAARLTASVKAGQLKSRGDVNVVSPEFQPIVSGVNEMIEAFVHPIDLTADYVDRIARGDLPSKITDHYEGDFDLIKQNLNRCIDVVNDLVSDATMLSRAAVGGKLDTRADASRHEGDYRKIVQGVNDCLDAVVNPINEAAQVLEKLAQRDLRARVRGDYQGDHAKIKEALNATAEALHESLAQVAQAVEQVSSASGQIASSSEAVAAGASEQASSLEETSASLESMASMTKQAADNAQQANGLAQTAQTAASDGSAAMEQMTGAMGKIKASAEGTSQIIKDINEIAFQTNLLALNAAVEAARAGEAGRGFAVVAEEVRSLALRSKEAANKTEELIRQSVKEAGEGEVTAKHVNEKLADISKSVTKVSGIIAEIAATAKEQAVGIDQVTKAVMQMNQVTQQNAASSEEASSAAAELSGQSEELAAMVGTFQLQTQASGAKAPRVQGAGNHGAAQRPTKPTANGNKKTTPTAKNGHALPHPASVIPLEGDPSFKDF